MRCWSTVSFNKAAILLGFFYLWEIKCLFFAFLSSASVRSPAEDRMLLYRKDRMRKRDRGGAGRRRGGGER